MIVHRVQGLRTLLGLVQGVLLAAVFWASYAVFCLLISPGAWAFADRYAVYLAVLLAGFVAELLTRAPDKLTAPIYDSSLLRRAPVAIRQMFFVIGALLLFLFLTKDHTISRVFLCGYSVLLYLAILWSGAFWPMRLARWLFTGQRENGTLLVGHPRRIGALSHWMERKKSFGINVVGLIATEPAADSAAAECPVPIVGSIAQLDELITTPAISQVILLEMLKPELAKRLITMCQGRGLRLLIVNDFAELLGQPMVSCVDEGVNILSLHDEPLENPFNRLLKGLLDFFVAGVAVILVLPWLTLLVWVLQRLQSPGPLWHKQPRAGLQNRTFTIVKFRTMHTEACELTRQASAHDERIYPAGRWLRRFSLDEMPQFFNVLRREMSVVGPRPHLVEHNKQFAELLAGYHFRTFIKPGITGLAQVRGFRGEAHRPEDLAARLKSDMIYLENWSLSLDLGIIARTLWQMIRPPRTAV